MIKDEEYFKKVVDVLKELNSYENRDLIMKVIGNREGIEVYHYLFSFMKVVALNTHMEISFYGYDDKSVDYDEDIWKKNALGEAIMNSFGGIYPTFRVYLFAIIICSCLMKDLDEILKVENKNKFDFKREKSFLFTTIDTMLDILVDDLQNNNKDISEINLDKQLACIIYNLIQFSSEFVGFSKGVYTEKNIVFNFIKTPEKLPNRILLSKEGEEE